MDTNRSDAPYSSGFAMKRKEKFKWLRQNKIQKWQNNQHIKQHGWKSVLPILALPHWRKCHLDGYQIVQTRLTRLGKKVWLRQNKIQKWQNNQHIKQHGWKSVLPILALPHCSFRMVTRLGLTKESSKRQNKIQKWQNNQHIKQHGWKSVLPILALPHCRKCHLDGYQIVQTRLTRLGLPWNERKFKWLRQNKIQKWQNNQHIKQHGWKSVLPIFSTATL